MLENFWLVPWYLMPIPEQKTYCLMLTNAQYSQEFTILFVGSLNMETFTEVSF